MTLTTSAMFFPSVITYGYNMWLIRKAKQRRELSYSAGENDWDYLRTQEEKMILYWNKTRLFTKSTNNEAKPDHFGRMVQRQASLGKILKLGKMNHNKKKLIEVKVARSDPWWHKQDLTRIQNSEWQTVLLGEIMSIEAHSNQENWTTKE